MKKFIAGLLVIVCILPLTACSKGSSNKDKGNTNGQTTSENDVKQDDTKIFGRITAIDGKKITFDIMKNEGEDNLCPLDKNGESGKNATDVQEGPNNDAPAQNGNGNVARPAPEGDVTTFFLVETGVIKKVTIDENVKVLYPDGTERPFSDLNVGSVISFNLDKPNGQIVSITVIG